MEGLNISPNLTTILTVIAVGVAVMVFQWRQNAAMEKRLREDRIESVKLLRSEIAAVAQSVETAKSELRGEIVAAEDRLRGEIAVVAQSIETAKSELRGEITATEDRLRGEITAVAQSVETAKSELRGEIADVSRRLERNDDNVRRLIQDVGVVQGAVLGVSIEREPREPAATT